MTLSSALLAVAMTLPSSLQNPMRPTPWARSGLMQQHSLPRNFVCIVSLCTSSMMPPASFSGKGMERLLRSPSTITLTWLLSDSSLDFHRLPLNYVASIPRSLQPLCMKLNLPGANYSCQREQLCSKLLSQELRAALDYKLFLPVLMSCTKQVWYSEHGR